MLNVTSRSENYEKAVKLILAFLYPESLVSLFFRCGFTSGGYSYVTKLHNCITQPSNPCARSFSLCCALVWMHVGLSVEYKPVRHVPLNTHQKLEDVNLV